jgi:hypothetical protein
VPAPRGSDRAPLPLPHAVLCDIGARLRHSVTAGGELRSARIMHSLVG